MKSWVRLLWQFRATAALALLLLSGLVLSGDEDVFNRDGCGDDMLIC